MITEAALIQSIRLLAEEFPDVTYRFNSGYSECQYTPDHHNPMGCIVGAALTRLGVPAECLIQLNDPAYAWRRDQWPAVTQAAIAQHVSREASSSVWVCKAQQGQDQGMTWGDAVRMADEQTGRSPHDH